MAATSAVVFGKARNGVSPLQRSRHSSSLGARRSGSWLQPPSPRTALRRERTSAGTGAVIGRAYPCAFDPSADEASRAAQPVVDRLAQAGLRDRGDGNGLGGRGVGGAQVGEQIGRRLG